MPDYNFAEPELSANATTALHFSTPKHFPKAVARLDEGLAIDHGITWMGQRRSLLSLAASTTSPDLLVHMFERGANPNGPPRTTTPVFFVRTT